jgi:hypothetical protein
MQQFFMQLMYVCLIILGVLCSVAGLFNGAESYKDEQPVQSSNVQFIDTL